MQLLKLPVMGLGIGIPTLIPLRDSRCGRECTQACRLSGRVKYVFDTAAAYYSIPPSSLAAIILTYYTREVLDELVSAGLIHEDSFKKEELI